MKASVRFHTTKVPSHQSLQEVAGMLRQYGAQRFEQVWEAGRTTAVRFNLPTPDAEFGHMNIVLRPRVDVLARKLKRQHGIDDPDQVERVAWRQLRGILEGILLAVDTGMFSVGQVFLGMAETDTGTPLWDTLAKSATLALPPAVAEAEWSVEP